MRIPFFLRRPWLIVRGTVTNRDRLVVRHGGQTVTDASLTDMKHAFKETLNHV